MGGRAGLTQPRHISTKRKRARGARPVLISDRFVTNRPESVELFNLRGRVINQRETGVVIKL